MRVSIVTTSVIAFVLATAVAAHAALTSGSLLNGTISQSYSSRTAQVGQAVALRNVTSDDGSGSVTGGTLYGTVVSVQRAGQGRAGRIAFRFTRLVTGRGASYAVDASVTQMQANTKNNALKEAGGAVAGMLVGNMLGKSLLHVGGGGFVGAAGGFLLAKNNKQDVTVSAGSIVQVRINSVTRRQAH